MTDSAATPRHATPGPVANTVAGLTPRATFHLRPRAIVLIVLLALVLAGSIAVPVSAGDALPDAALESLVFTAVVSALLLGAAVSIPPVIGPHQQAVALLRDRFAGAFVTTIDGSVALDGTLDAAPVGAGSSAWLVLEPDRATVWVRSGLSLVRAVSIDRARITRSRIDPVGGPRTGPPMGVFLSVRSPSGETEDLRILPAWERMAARMRLVCTQENRNAAINHWAKTGATT